MLRDINLVTIALRTVLVLLIGGLLGLERGRKNRPAGLRTHMLVCLGAAVVMMTNQYAHQYFAMSDPVRMGAQVVSGIGFLGAGTILVTGKNQVKGITTAAGLWAAACSGLAVGIGFYEGALLSGLCVYFVMAIMQRMDRRIHSRSRAIDLYVEMREDEPFSRFMEYARENGFDICDVQLRKNKLAEGGALCAVLTAVCRESCYHYQMTDLLMQAPGVSYLEEIRE